MAHEWLPKVTHLISGRSKTIICYISLLCLLDFVALMFSLLVSGSVTCSSRSVYMAVCMHAQSCLTLFDPMGCSLPASSIHGIFQARILEWVATSFSRGSSQPRDQTCISCIGREIREPTIGKSCELNVESL